MQFFFVNKLNDNTLILQEMEYHHCIKVLRNKVGDEVWGIDGIGNSYKSVIQYIENEIVHLLIQNTFQNVGELKNKTALAFGLLKDKERMEWMVEKATELGVFEMYPLVCEHCERKEWKMDRAEKIILSAVKQSKRSYIPKIHLPQDISLFINTLPNLFSLKLVAYCDAQPILQTFQYQLINQNCLYFIGPEGDFSISEIESMKKANIQEISLGNVRLRSETAVIHLLSISKFLNS